MPLEARQKRFAALHWVFIWAFFDYENIVFMRAGQSSGCKSLFRLSGKTWQLFWKYPNLHCISKRILFEWNFVHSRLGLRHFGKKTERRATKRTLLLAWWICDGSFVLSVLMYKFKLHFHLKYSNNVFVLRFRHAMLICVTIGAYLMPLICYRPALRCGGKCNIQESRKSHVIDFLLSFVLSQVIYGTETFCIKLWRHLQCL